MRAPSRWAQDRWPETWRARLRFRRAGRERLATTESSPQTPEGVLLTRLVPELVRLNGRLLAAGDAMTRDLALTSVRWQVLGAVRLPGGPPPVPWIVRTMGLTRQAVPRVAGELPAEGFVRSALVNVAEWASADAFLGAAATGEFREPTRRQPGALPAAIRASTGSSEAERRRLPPSEVAHLLQEAVERGAQRAAGVVDPAGGGRHGAGGLVGAGGEVGEVRQAAARVAGGGRLLLDRGRDRGEDAAISSMIWPMPAMVETTSPLAPWIAATWEEMSAVAFAVCRPASSPPGRRRRSPCRPHPRAPPRWWR